MSIVDYCYRIPMFLSKITEPRNASLLDGLLRTNLIFLGVFMTYFWLIAGFMAGIASAFFVVRLWGVGLSSLGSLSRRNLTLLIAAVFVFLAISATMYLGLGRPEMVIQGINPASGLPNHPASTTEAGGATGSMSEATEKLAKRLASGDGSDQDWLLLQQSYEFLGDSEGAELAQKHQIKSANTDLSDQVNPTQGEGSQIISQPKPGNAVLENFQQKVARQPSDADSWLAIAQMQRTARNFTESSAAFEKVIKLKKMTADAWADYADVSATLAKTLTNNATRAALDAALKLEPGHSKALWLKASLAHEEKRYADALKLWKQLRAVIPNNSPDVTIIDANIKEAQGLSGNAVISGTKARVIGSISIDPALKDSVSPNAVLFVYAKASDSPMPVAVYRTPINSWPVNFELDDSQAMMPTRKLSQFELVTISARVSRGGQALAQSGDLQSDAISVKTADSKSVELRVNKRIP